MFVRFSTRQAHDLGSDDDCTCVVIYLRPAEIRRGMDASSKRTSETEDMGEADEDLAASSSLACGAGAEEDDDEEEEEEELEEDDEMEGPAGAEDNKFDASADSAYEYEKWRNPIQGNEDADKDEEDNNAVDHIANKDQDVWDLSTATFPVSLVATQMGMETLFPSSAVDFQDAPEVSKYAPLMINTHVAGHREGTQASRRETSRARKTQKIGGGTERRDPYLHCRCREAILREHIQFKIVSSIHCQSLIGVPGHSARARLHTCILQLDLLSTLRFLRRRRGSKYVSDLCLFAPPYRLACRDDFRCKSINKEESLPLSFMAIQMSFSVPSGAVSVCEELPSDF